MDDSDFYSIDRLIEFGMGAAVAAQMANSMNVGLQQMKTPGVDNPMIPATESVYYVVLDGAAAGPFSVTELSRLIAEKKVCKETYVWKPGMPQWGLAENVEEVLKLVALTPPPVPVD